MLRSSRRRMNSILKDQPKCSISSINSTRPVNCINQRTSAIRNSRTSCTFGRSPTVTFRHVVEKEKKTIISASTLLMTVLYLRANGSLEKVLEGDEENGLGGGSDHGRSLRQRIHEFCEGDGTLASTIFSFASIFFVLLSVLGLIIGSIHDFQVPIVKAGLKNKTLLSPDGNYSRFLKWPCYYVILHAFILFDPQ